MEKYVVFGNAGSVHLVKWVCELVKHFEVFVITPSDVHPELLEYLDDSHIFNLGLATKTKGGNFGILKSFFSVKKIIDQIRPQFVNAHYITSHGFIAALIKSFSVNRFKLIQSAWGTDILVTPKKNILYKVITRFSLKQAELITSDAMYMSSKINEMSEIEVMTFPFGLDNLPGVDPGEKDNNLFFSNRALTANYNVDKVILFFYEIFVRNPNSRLIIANDGDKMNQLKQLVSKLELGQAIKFVGFIDKARQNQLYKKARFYISLPTSDSTSVSLLEAMAYGCIPILSDIDCNREWIENGNNGLIFKGDIGFVEDSLKKSDEIFLKNRNIIAAKALFPKSIEKFVERLKAL